MRSTADLAFLPSATVLFPAEVPSRYSLPRDSPNGLGHARQHVAVLLGRNAAQQRLEHPRAHRRIFRQRLVGRNLDFATTPFPFLLRARPAVRGPTTCSALSSKIISMVYCLTCSSTVLTVR